MQNPVLTPQQLMAQQRMGNTEALQQQRLLMQLYNRQYQPDLSGITDVGSGIARGVQNALGMFQQSRQQNQMAKMMQQEQAQQQAQAQALQEQQAQAQQAQMNSLRDMFSTTSEQPAILGGGASGNMLPPIEGQSPVQSLGGMAGAYASPALDIGMQQVKTQTVPDSFLSLALQNPTVMANLIQQRLQPQQQILGAQDTKNIPGASQTLSPMTPADTNALKLYGLTPTSNRDMAKQDLELMSGQADLYKKQTENSVLPQQLQYGLTNTVLSNQGKELSNYSQKINNQYLDAEKKLALLKGGQDSQSKALEIQATEKKIQGLAYLQGPEAQAQIQDALNRGDTNALKQIEAKASLLGINLGLADGQKTTTSINTSDGKITYTNVKKPDGSTITYDNKGNIVQTVLPNGSIQLPQR